MPNLTSVNDISNKLREQLLDQAILLATDLFDLSYEVSAIFKVKTNYTTEIDREIQATNFYFKFTDEWRFFYFKDIKWNTLKLKLLLDNYLETLLPEDYLIIKINLSNILNNKYYIDNLDIRGTWVDNPVLLTSRQKILYDESLSGN